MSISSRPYPRSSSSGFTLVEMLMVVAIICLITLVLFVRQNAFDSATLLRSLSYSVALSLEQAQTYGVSVRGFSANGSAAQFAPGYGVYFSSTLTCTNGTRTCYLIFADLNGDHCRAGDAPCGTSAGSEDFPLYNLSRGYAIKDVCGISSSNSTVRSCLVSPQGGGTALTSMTIYFKRPDPDALFYSSNATTFTGESYSAVYVQLWSPSDTANVRTIKITPTGQVSVCALNIADPNTC